MKPTTKTDQPTEFAQPPSDPTGEPDITISRQLADALVVILGDAYNTATKDGRLARHAERRWPELISAIQGSESAPPPGLSPGGEWTADGYIPPGNGISFREYQAAKVTQANVAPPLPFPLGGSEPPPVSASDPVTIQSPARFVLVLGPRDHAALTAEFARQDARWAAHHIRRSEIEGNLQGSNLFGFRVADLVRELTEARSELIGQTLDVVRVAARCLNAAVVSGPGDLAEVDIEDMEEIRGTVRMMASDIGMRGVLAPTPADKEVRA